LPDNGRDGARPSKNRAPLFISVGIGLLLLLGVSTFFALSSQNPKPKTQTPITQTPSQPQTLTETNHEAARLLLATAQQFAAQNPEDFNGQLTRFQNVITQFPQTPAAQEAQQQVAQLIPSANLKPSETTNPTTLDTKGIPAGAIVREFIGHETTVNSVCFSPDGQYGLSASGDKTVKIWNLASGQLIRTLNGHTGGVSCAVFSSDGRYVLSGSLDTTMKLWDAGSGKEIRTLSGHERGVSSAVFSPDGRYILSGSHDSTMKLWDIESGKELQTFKTDPRGDGVVCVAYNPDGCTIISIRSNGKMEVWEVETGEKIETIKPPKDEMTGGRSIAFSPDGQNVVAGSLEIGKRGMVIIYDVVSGSLLKTLEGHSAGVYSVAYSPDGRFILSGSWDKTMKLWDVANGREMRTFGGNTSPSPPARQARGGREMRTFGGNTSPIFGVAFSPDGCLALSGGGRGMVLWKLWDDELQEKIRIQTVQEANRIGEELKRAREQARHLAEVRRQSEEAESERAKVLQAFGEFQKSFLAALTQRDYAGAQRQAQQASDNPLLESLKERAVAFGEVAARLDKFWSSLPTTLASLKGKTVTLQGETGIVTDIAHGELILEKKIGDAGAVETAIPLAKLTLDEIALLTMQAKPSDKDSLLSLAWLHFVAENRTKAFEKLADAERAGADKLAITVLRELAQHIDDQLYAERASRIEALLTSAKSNDSQEKGRTALAALEELLKLAPQHQEAIMLRDKISIYYVKAGDCVSIENVEVYTVQAGAVPTLKGVFRNNLNRPIYNFQMLYRGDDRMGKSAAKLSPRETLAFQFHILPKAKMGEFKDALLEITFYLEPPSTSNRKKFVVKYRANVDGIRQEDW
jgi:WD40 repeat protein